MELSIFYEHILEAAQQTGQPMAELLKAVRGFGIEAVEISFGTLAGNELEVMEELRAADLCISCIYGMYDFASSADASPAYAQVDAAVRCGAEKILVVPGFYSSEDTEKVAKVSFCPEKTKQFMDACIATQNMKAALTQLVAYASAKNVTVTLEDFDSDDAPYATINGLCWFMENVPGLKYTLDTGNFAYSDEDVVEAYNVLKPYIAHVHCKDRGEQPGVRGKISKGLAPVATGEGYLPVIPLVQKLVAGGYQGYFAIEHFDSPDQLGFAKQSAGNLREAVK